MARELPAVLPGGNGEKPARDARGRFVAGAAPGPGRPANPFARYQRELRQALLAEVAPADLRAVLKQVLRLAKGGSLQATELLLRWTLGGPPPALDPDKLDAHEREVRTGRLTMLDHLTLAADPAAADEAGHEADADDSAEDPPDDPRAPTSPPLRTVLAWALEELAQAQTALRTQALPPPEPAQGWARFVEQRLEFDETAAVAGEQLYLTYLRWCAGHGEVPLEEERAVAWLTQHGVTRRPAAPSPGALLVGVRVVA